ncbi:fimbrillin family protein [Bacteroides sp. AN502(2024)]|uniref:fimbrillin family protein n=1 Tax=Bacteroides sp. AN502(2024) TaxID=3160599 RepID=UPI0035126A75
MKKKLFVMAFPALVALVSCSNDEMVQLSDGNAIKYQVNTGAISRAANVFCNNNKPSEFMVWANLTDNGSTQPYIAGDRIKDENGAWSDVTGTRYWPNTGTLDFYAVVNGGTLNAETRALSKFTVASEVSAQQDLLYAVATGQTKPATTASSPVNLNFRHALSQIVFKAKSKNQTLHIEVDGVAVGNLHNAAVFALPENSTTGNIAHAIPNPGGTLASQGTWGSAEGAEVFKVSFNTKEIAYSSDGSTVTNLTDQEAHTAASDFGKALLMLPTTTTTAWSGTSKLEGIQSDRYAAKINDGTFILVKMAIWNVADLTTGKQNTDVLLYGNTADDGTVTTRWAAIPASFTWEQGKKYIYTLTFDKGNGGLDPDPDDPDPDPVLVKIEYEVKVDEFVKGNDTPIDMNK